MQDFNAINCYCNILQSRIVFIVIIAIGIAQLLPYCYHDCLFHRISIILKCLITIIAIIAIN